MDTINDILTEMPDQTMPEELFQDAARSTTFEKKEAVEEEKKTSIIEDKPRINDRFSKDLKIDLNDRIAFIKHLFNNENSDYQRVIRQIFTYSTLDEAKAFINEMVKPEYNNWLGKDTYEERFLRVIELYFDPPN